MCSVPWAGVPDRQYLVQLVPGGVQVLVDHMTPEGLSPDTRLHIGVALPLHHAAHEIVLGDQVPRLHQMNPQHPLEDGKCST